METTISVGSDNAAIRDVMTVQLYEELVKTEGISVTQKDAESSDERVARLGALELLATFVTSAAAYQLALALRDFVRRQSVELQLISAEGEVFLITATGGDPESISNIVGFLTRQHQKESTEIKHSYLERSEETDDGEENAR